MQIDANQWKFDGNDADSDVDSVASDGSEVSVATTSSNISATRTTARVGKVTPSSAKSPIAAVNVAIQETLPDI
jgi:hypothetical protein